MHFLFTFRYFLEFGCLTSCFPLTLHTRLSTRQNCLARPHLYQHVGRVVEAHDQRSHPGHVVHVGEGDEGDGCQVVQEHDQKILGTTRDEKEQKSHN